MNIEILRSMLAEQMVRLKSGKADPKHVNAMCNAAGKVIGSVRLELEYARMLGVTPAISFIKTTSEPTKVKALKRNK